MSIKTQAVVNNMVTNSCPCCERIWLSVISSGASPVLYYDPIDEELLASVVWQEYTDPNIWGDVQTGGNILLEFNDNYYYRVKYTDAKGCIHYSNVGVAYYL